MHNTSKQLKNFIYLFMGSNLHTPETKYYFYYKGEQ